MFKVYVVSPELLFLWNSFFVHRAHKVNIGCKTTNDLMDEKFSRIVKQYEIG